MLGYLRIFTNLRQRQHCIKFQILSRLRTPWQYYPAFWVFFERQSAVEDPVPKIANPVCKNAKKSSVNVSMLKAGHNTVSHHRLSLLFPKLRLSNFMISSLASAIFVQCPPWWKKNVHTIEPCRLNLLLQSVATPQHWASFLVGLPQYACRPLKRSESLLWLQSSIYGPGVSPSTTSHVFEADKLLSIHNHLFLFITTSLNWKKQQKSCSNSFFISKKTTPTI